MQRLLAWALVAAIAPTAGVATTFNPVPVNQGFIVYDNVNSNVNPGNFNLALGPVALSALFTQLDVTGSLSFGVFMDPHSSGDGAKGSLDINLTRQGNPSSFGSDNETFEAVFGGQKLAFQQVNNNFVASFETAFSGISDIVQFDLNFTGFDPGDQFQINVAAVTAIPLPAPLPLFMGAFGALGFLAWRRRRSA